MATNKNSADIKQLIEELANLRAQLGQVDFQAATGKIKNVHQTRTIRKQIARVLTKIHQLSYQHG